MDALLTWILAALIFGYLVWGLRRAETVYEFPFLAAVLTVSFVLPQLPALVDDRWLPPGSYTKTIAFTIACIAALGIGWNLPARPLKFMRQVYQEQGLLISAAGLSLVGAYFYYQFSRLPGEETVAVELSGVPVVYLFFARLMPYGLAIATLCCARRISWLGVTIIAFDLIFYLDRIVITGKRAEAVELLLIFALPLWFQRRWAVPRAATLALIGLGTLAMFSMTEYRNITRTNTGPDWEQLFEIDVVGNFYKQLEQGGPEARNAVIRINATDSGGLYDYGAFHWNRLVSDYVPAQLVGAAAKHSLMLPLPTAEESYDPPVGTTETGMADAFQSFWYFGAFKFMLLAYLIRRIWVTAMLGHTTAQIVFMLSIVPSMHAISHQTDWVVSVWVHMLLFLMPALYFATIRQRKPTVSTRLSAPTGALG